MVSRSTRLKVVGLETTALGIFLLLTFTLDAIGSSAARWLPSITSDLPILGIAMTFVGLETISLVRKLPGETARGAGRSNANSVKIPSAIDLRATVAYDIRLHGSRSILAEFLIASAIGAVLFLLYAINPDVSAQYRPFAFFWLGFSLNCATLLVVSAKLARTGTDRDRSLVLSPAERAWLLRSSLAIIVLLIVPFAALALGLVKRDRDRRSRYS